MRDAAVDPPGIARDLVRSGGSRQGPALAQGALPGFFNCWLGSEAPVARFAGSGANALVVARFAGLGLKRPVAPLAWSTGPRSGRSGYVADGRQRRPRQRPATRHSRPATPCAPATRTCDPNCNARPQLAPATCARDSRARAIRPRPALASARLGTLRERRKRWGALGSALGECRGEDSMCFYSSHIVLK